MLDTLLAPIIMLVEGGSVYGYLLPIYVGLLSAERIAHALFERQVRWNNAEAASNIFLTVVFLGLGILIGHILPLGLMVFIFENFRLFELGSGLMAWIGVFLLYDLAWYTDHRIAHRTGFFWAMHHVHHSCPEYNMTVASRGFLLDSTMLSRPTFYLLPVLGVAPDQYILMSIITNVWGIAQHTRMVGKLGVIDRLFATPSSHRVHHGSDTHYLDRNYGEVLMVWDHLFGTYTPEEEEPLYGVTVPIATANPIKIQAAGLQWFFGRYQRAHGWRERLRAIYKPPEWEPNTASVEEVQSI